MGSLGDRMKQNYEGVFRHDLLRRTPCIVRVDGRAFHSFTRGMHKPFDPNFMNAMNRSALDVAREMQGFKCAYVQSDEASFLLTDYDELTTQAWFGYDQSKVESIAASLMTASFNSQWSVSDYTNQRAAHFDARAFSMPREDVANYFLWRMKDWYRNSVQMYARAHFSHKELHGLPIPALHDLLHDKGKNWATDTTGTERNGTFHYRTADGIKTTSSVMPRFDEVHELLSPLVYCDEEWV